MKKFLCAAICLLMICALAACRVNVNISTNPEKEPAETDDGQNPVMNFVGPYASGDYNALVEAEGKDNAKITIECGDPARPDYSWVMSGPFDPDTLTVDYTNCVMTSYNWTDINTLPGSKVEYENGEGRVEFDAEKLTFTWRNDNSDWEDVVFEWSFEPDE